MKIFEVMEISEQCGVKKFAALDRGPGVAGYVFYKNRRGTFFLKLRGKRGMFFYWAGFWRDTGGVFQLLRT